MSTPAAYRTQQDIHSTAIVVDLRDPTHLMYRLTYEEKPDYIAALLEGGVTASVVDAMWVDDGFRDAALSLASWHRRIASNPKTRVALRRSDIESAKSNGQVAFILSSQSSSAVDGHVELVEMLGRLGVRIMQLTYQHRTLAGDGCGEKADGGLSHFGRDLVKEMCRVGMLVDLSHASDRTVLDAAEEATRPVLLSHTNARALCNTKRNGSDEMFKAVAATGGVIGVSAYSALLTSGGGERGTTVHEMLTHVDYLCDLVGEDHVALGLDIGEGRSPHEVHLLHTLIAGLGPGPKHRYVAELKSRSNLRSLTEAMEARGYDEARIRKILGLNFVRVFERVCG